MPQGLITVSKRDVCDTWKFFGEGRWSSMDVFCIIYTRDISQHCNLPLEVHASGCCLGKAVPYGQQEIEKKRKPASKDDGRRLAGVVRCVRQG
jgi:hypothetical protein